MTAATLLIRWHHSGVSSTTLAASSETSEIQDVVSCTSVFCFNSADVTDCRQSTRLRAYSSSSDRSFAVAGQRLWDSLPANLRQTTSHWQLRLHLKVHGLINHSTLRLFHFLHYANTLTYLLTYVGLHCKCGNIWETVQDRDHVTILPATNRKWSMAYRIALFPPITLSNHRGHWPIASLFKYDFFVYICVAVDKISTLRRDDSLAEYKVCRVPMYRVGLITLIATTNPNYQHDRGELFLYGYPRWGQSRG